MPPSIWDRLSFWQRVHERLPRLSNRIDATAQGKLLAQLHEQIPMVTPEEQRTLQLENAEADDKFWDGFRDLAAGNAQGHKQLASAARRKLADDEAAMANAATLKADARERVERLKRGGGRCGRIRTAEDLQGVAEVARLERDRRAPCSPVGRDG
jgi:hypothetical protein